MAPSAAQALANLRCSGPPGLAPAEEHALSVLNRRGLRPADHRLGFDDLEAALPARMLSSTMLQWLTASNTTSRCPFLTPTSWRSLCRCNCVVSHATPSCQSGMARCSTARRYRAFSATVFASLGGANGLVLGTPTISVTSIRFSGGPANTRAISLPGTVPESDGTPRLSWGSPKMKPNSGRAKDACSAVRLTA